MLGKERQTDQEREKDRGDRQTKRGMEGKTNSQREGEEREGETDKERERDMEGKTDKETERGVGRDRKVGYRDRER